MQSRFSTRSLLLSLRSLTAAAAIAAAATANVPGASAANFDPDSMLGAPASAEVTPTRQVLSSVPFNRFYVLSTCNASLSTCYLQTPRLAANVRWVFQFVSCTADTNTGATFRHFSLQVTDASFRLLGIHYIAPTHQSDPGKGNAAFTASQPIVLSAEPNSVIFLVASASDSLASVRCAVSGVQQRLG
jgi:hypothetical protein